MVMRDVATSCPWPGAATTVYRDGLTVDELSITHADSGCDASYIVGRPPSLEQRFATCAFVPINGGRYPPIRFDPTWEDAIDSNPWSIRFGETF